MGYAFATIQLINSLLNTGEKTQSLRHIFEGTIIRKAGQSTQNEFFLAHKVRIA